MDHHYTGRGEEDGYAIIENMIVMPVAFLVIFALLFAGCILHAKCTIESAAKRGVLYASKLICDPQYEKITERAIDKSKGELNELASEEYDFTRIGHYEPYRYIPFLSSGMSGVEAGTESYVQSIIDQNVTWMFTIDTDSIVCEAKNYVITQNLKVRVTASYYTPKIFHYLGIPETYELTAESVMTVSDQDEFIRNADFAADLIRDVADATGIGDKISGAMDKMRSFMEKLFK